MLQVFVNVHPPALRNLGGMFLQRVFFRSLALFGFERGHYNLVNRRLFDSEAPSSFQLSDNAENAFVPRLSSPTVASSLLPERTKLYLQAPGLAELEVEHPKTSIETSLAHSVCKTDLAAGELNSPFERKGKITAGVLSDVSLPCETLLQTTEAPVSIKKSLEPPSRYLAPTHAAHPKTAFEVGSRELFYCTLSATDIATQDLKNYLPTLAGISLGIDDFFRRLSAQSFNVSYLLGLCASVLLVVIRALGYQRILDDFGIAAMVSLDFLFKKFILGLRLTYNACIRFLPLLLSHFRWPLTFLRKTDAPLTDSHNTSNDIEEITVIADGEDSRKEVSQRIRLLKGLRFIFDRTAHRMMSERHARLEFVRKDMVGLLTNLAHCATSFPPTPDILRVWRSFPQKSIVDHEKRTAFTARRAPSVTDRDHNLQEFHGTVITPFLNLSQLNFLRYLRPF